MAGKIDNKVNLYNFFSYQAPLVEPFLTKIPLSTNSANAFFTVAILILVSLNY